MHQVMYRRNVEQLCQHGAEWRNFLSIPTRLQAADGTPCRQSTQESTGSQTRPAADLEFFSSVSSSLQATGDGDDAVGQLMMEVDSSPPGGTQLCCFSPSGSETHGVFYFLDFVNLAFYFDAGC